MEKGHQGTGIFRRYIIAALWIFICLVPCHIQAQQAEEKPARILFLLDASSSMLTDWNAPESRFEAAARIISAIVDSVHAVNRDVAFAVRVFGSGYPAQDKNCYDTRLEVPFNLGNDAQIRARLKYLSPKGYSPIAWSLQKTAEEDFKESNRYSYSIILLTDGGESCGGDICATVTTLLAQKISFKPYILSLIDYEPLKLQYACLGKYLTVAREKDIVPAIRTIINDNRAILTIKSPGVTRIQQHTAPPVATPVRTKPVLPEIKQEPVVTVKQEPVKEPVVVKQAPVENPPVKKEEPVQKEEPVIPRPKVLVDRIVSLNKLHRLNLLYTLPEGRPVKVPGLSTIRIQTEGAPPATAAAPKTNTPAATPPATRPPANKPVAKTGKPEIIEPSGPVKPPTTGGRVNRSNEKKKEETLEFVVKTEDAKESTLQIYFTNGQGRFYSTEPRMSIKDSKTGKEVKNVYRNVLGGEPTPIKLDPGTYDVIIPGTRSKATGVVIEPGKNKKYYIKVGSGSLAFYYPTAPDRPVKEYMALVSKRFESGPVVKQKCDQEFPYDPTNYHIEVNTLPPMMLNVDLEFNNIKLISIPEPGTVQISNTDKMGKVQFWYKLGDAYVPFYEMMVAGNTGAQKVDFLPGLYQVRYYKEAPGPFSQAEVIFFRVKSNMTTTIELEK